MKELALLLARSLAQVPDRVEVSESEEDGSTVLRLRVAPEDVGRIIGRQGRAVKAMRTVLSAAASRARRRVVLHVVEETGDGGRSSAP